MSPSTVVQKKTYKKKQKQNKPLLTMLTIITGLHALNDPHPRLGQTAFHCLGSQHWSRGLDHLDFHWEQCLGLDLANQAQGIMDSQCPLFSTAINKSNNVFSLCGTKLKEISYLGATRRLLRSTVGFSTYPQPPFSRNLPWFNSMGRPGVWNQLCMRKKDYSVIGGIAELRNTWTAYLEI